jgi:4-azaleucine resistance transporter AzlC
MNEAVSTTETEPARRQASFADGVRVGWPFALAGLFVSASFGAVAQTAGLSPLEAIVMSAVVFAGAAQFASIAILAGGGTLVAAVAAGALVNARFLPMSVALTPSLRGGRLRRAVEGQALIDTSWALSSRGDGTYDRTLLMGATAIQYLTWVGGTALGVAFGELVGDTTARGLDAIFPAFFVSLLLKEARDARSRAVAALGGAVALLLVPVAPAGVPVLAASLAALVGLRRVRDRGGEPA